MIIKVNGQGFRTIEGHNHLHSEQSILQYAEEVQTLRTIGGAPGWPNEKILKITTRYKNFGCEDRVQTRYFRRFMDGGWGWKLRELEVVPDHQRVK